MSERRKYKRVDVNVAIKGKLIDPQKKLDITGDISMRAKNLSEGGALLEWPRSWKCSTCSNCLGWVHNFNCKLKESGQMNSEFNKELVPEMHITIQIIPGNDIGPVNALVKISWVKSLSLSELAYTGLINLGWPKTPSIKVWPELGFNSVCLL